MFDALNHCATLISIWISIGRWEHLQSFFLNIMSNFIPNEHKRIVPRDHTVDNKVLIVWLTRKTDYLKTLKGMVINQRTKSGLITFVKTLKDMVINQRTKSGLVTFVKTLKDRVINQRTKSGLSNFRKDFKRHGYKPEDKGQAW